MFKKGDLVVAKVTAGFSITNEMALVEVTSVDTEENTFNGRLVAHKSAKLKEHIGSTYKDLPMDEFDVATVAQQNDIKGIKPDKVKPEQTIKLGNLTVNFYPASIESNFNATRKMATESDVERIKQFRKIREGYDKQKSIYEFRDIADLSVFGDILDEKKRASALTKLIDFFVEFQFEPNFRFVNTLAHKLQQSEAAGKDYILNYFSLANNPFVTAIEDKIKSPEFTEIIATIGLIEPSSYINKRLKIYYGSQGTGKTTKAMEETKNQCIVCNNSILPQDLMEDFAFDDGKPGFHKSILCKCMESGEPITLDEINLLPFETIRFLQGILDDKKEFIWKGETVKIKDGFKIIGTMNLMVNGMAFGLPEPLIDRCEDIKKYALTGKDLLRAIE